jgi:transcriptional regulator with XRE-family HTH domain
MARKKAEPLSAEGKPVVNPRLAALGQRIRRLREEADMTQRDMAAAIGVSQAYINVMESGVSNLGYMTLVNIADALGVPISALVEDEEEAGRNPMDPVFARIARDLERLLVALETRRDNIMELLDRLKRRTNN